MNALALALVCTAGIEVGWQPVEEGAGVEYIVQLDEETLEILKGGDVFISDIPAQVKDVRRLQIAFGNRKLPRKLPKPISPPPGVTQAPVASTLPREPGRFMPDEASQPLNPPADSATQLVAGAETGLPKGKKSTEPKVLPAKGSSSLEALMNSKGSGSEPPPADGPGHAAPAVPAAAASPLSSEPTRLTDLPAEPRPWLPLIGAMLGLFGSLGANVFLGWLWFGERSRYRNALARLAPRRAPGAV